MNIKVSFTNDQEGVATDNFVTSFKSQFTQISKQYDQAIVSIDNSDSNVNQYIQNIANKLLTDNFFQSIQISSDNSYIKLSNANIKNVNLNMVVDGVYNAMQQDKEIIDQTTNLESSILQSSTSIAESGFKQIITWIVYIVLGIVTLIILIYIFTIIFQVFSVYVSK